MGDNAGGPLYQAVVNQEEQYSIWPRDRDLPLGWRAAGCEGDKATVLAWIEAQWVDMRPKSLRDALARAERDRQG